jgi:peroxiredoxin
MTSDTANPLDQARREILATFGPAEWAAYNHLVKWLRDTDVSAHALKVGDLAPDFLLPDSDGHLVSSEDLRRRGTLVVSFFRGGWCPFCTAELCALQTAKDEFDTMNAQLVVVTPDTRHFPRELKREHGLDLTVLSDVDHGVSMAFGVLFSVPDETKAYYSNLGVDMAMRHGSADWMLPLPATYVIDQNGVIQQALVEPDFTIRPEPSEILRCIREIAK